MVQKEIEDSYQKIRKGNPEIVLDRPCRVGDGILSFSKEENQQLLKKAAEINKQLQFFIPASGSGSRMFSFLYQFLDAPNEQNTRETEHFFSQLKDLAIFHLLPKEMRVSIENGNYDMEDVLRFILTNKGMNLGESPKALVPFHWRAPIVLNALQEQLLQAQNIHPEISKIHFTTQEEYQTEFEKSLSSLASLAKIDLDITYSTQAKETDSLVFDENLQVVFNTNGSEMYRPSGHGALLENLNRIEADYILVKNIDNVQHWEHHNSSKKWWNILLGTLELARLQMKKIIETENWAAFESVNDYFQLVPKDTWRNWSVDELKTFLNKPIRVCGMVKNIGQPGGGPYWVKVKNELTKQIVEKAQISDEESQRRIMIRSTHFNPVMMVLGRKDLNDKLFDLHQFVDQDKYFVVEKSHQGKSIKFIELPGLWNGGMGHWNTIFVEVPEQTFSPVKSVLDLLEPLHQEKQS